MKTLENLKSEFLNEKMTLSEMDSIFCGQKDSQSIFGCDEGTELIEGETGNFSYPCEFNEIGICVEYKFVDFKYTDEDSAELLKKEVIITDIWEH